LSTDKFILAEKQDVGEKFGTKKVSTIVDITNIDDHKLHSVTRNLVTSIAQKVAQDYEIIVKTDKVEIIDVSPSSMPDDVSGVSATVQVTHTKKSVVIKLRLYQSKVTPYFSLKM